MTDQASSLRKLINKEYKQRTRYIAITSGKGGVGKTNISVNLTLVLAKTGKEVMLLDANLGLSSVDVLLGISPKYSMNDIVPGKKQLSEISVFISDKAVLIPAGSGFEELADISDKKFAFLERQLANIKSPDFVIIDTAAGIGKNVTRYLEAADEIIVITTPDPTSITDAYVMIKLLRNRGKDNISIVANMVKNSSEADDIFEHIKAISEKFLKFKPNYLGFCPKDPLLIKAVRRRNAIINLFPYALFSKQIVKIAGKINRSAIQPKAGFVDFIKRLFTK